MRILFLADTHLGFDQPLRPRVVKDRRGPDFFASVDRALAPARRGEVDLVVHGGDLLYRSRVPPGLVQEALAPFLAVARAGVPVCLVPGNHERSRIPAPLFARHPNLHVFREPETFRLDVRGIRVAVSGFPFARRVDATAFSHLVRATGGLATKADLRLLCIHQAVEGACVGPADFTFRAGATDSPGQVIPGKAIPGGFAAVLAGHIHRHQVLTRDLAGRRLASPVLYPGSTERTSYAEQGETKGYLLLRAAPGRGGGRIAGWRFVPLPTPPLPPRFEETLRHAAR